MLSGANFVYFCMVLDLQKSMWSSDFIYPDCEAVFPCVEKGTGISAIYRYGSYQREETGLQCEVALNRKY